MKASSFLCSREARLCGDRQFPIILQLIKLREELGLGNITWHSGRIGAASEAARKKVSRNVIKRSGGWLSSAVDAYMRVDDPGVLVGHALSVFVMATSGSRLSLVMVLLWGLLKEFWWILMIAY